MRRCMIAPLQQSCNVFQRCNNNEIKGRQDRRRNTSFQCANQQPNFSLIIEKILSISHKNNGHVSWTWSWRFGKMVGPALFIVGQYHKEQPIHYHDSYAMLHAFIPPVAYEFGIVALTSLSFFLSLK